MSLVLALALGERTNDIGTVLLFQGSPLGAELQTRDHPPIPGMIKTRDGIILSPQPGDDPNDPLV